jgi:kynurenine formamidase
MKVKKIYDLTRPLYHNCPGWPGFALTDVQYAMVSPQDMCQVEKVTSLTHVATHADTPLHFHECAESMDQVPVDQWIGEGVVINMLGKEPKAPITYEDLEKHGKHVREGDMVALRTGYQKYYGFTQNYLKDWPAVDESGAQWLVDRKVKVYGCDTLGIESFYFPEGGPKAHKKILGAKICIVEELFLEEIGEFGEDKRWFFCWLPTLLKGAGGSFVRAVAMDVE